MQANDHQFSWKQRIKNLHQQQQQQLQQMNLVEINKEQLELSHISPIWANRLKEKQSLTLLLSFKRLRWLYEIVNARRCVVAEAYGFSSSYTMDCRECARIGNKFSFYFAFCLSNKVNENQKRFVKHWKKKHIKIN